jgi:hypothetical protein
VRLGVDSGMRSGSGWLIVVAFERGDQCGHFGGIFIRIGSLLSESCV